MANINETTAWAEGIYLIATTDDVIGGADGISNKAATQLACRTGYLKQQITYIKTGEIIAGKAEKLANPRAITMTGDATGAADFDGSGDINQRQQRQEHQPVSMRQMFGVKVVQRK